MWQTNRWSDGWTELRWLRCATAVAAVTRKKVINVYNLIINRGQSQSNRCYLALYVLLCYVSKSVRHVRSVLLPFDNYEAYDDLCQTTWCSRSSWRWCFPGLTAAPQHLPAFRSNSWTGFSLCRTPLHGWSSMLVVRTTFSHYCADCTGFGCQNALRSGWQC